jgi:hypothetical protein
MIDHMGMVDLFECSVKELRELDIIVTTLFKQKESRNG